MKRQTIPIQQNSIWSKIVYARKKTSRWALWLGVIVGSLGSLVVILDWISGAAVQHGTKGIVEAVIGTIIIIGFTIDSEIRLIQGRMVRK